MLVNVAIINKELDGNYYAYWYDDNANLRVEADADEVYLESKIINELGVIEVTFGYNYWNDTLDI